MLLWKNILKLGFKKKKKKKKKNKKKKHFGSFSSSTSNVSVTRSMEESCSTSVNEHYCRLMNIALTIALLRRELFNKHLWFRRVVGTTTFQLYPWQFEFSFCVSSNPDYVLYIYLLLRQFLLGFFIEVYRNSHYRCCVKVAVSKILRYLNKAITISARF